MNTWPGDKRYAIHQDVHDWWNATHYPGTRQLCSICGEPTGLCEDDMIYPEDGEPICESCNSGRLGNENYSRV